MILAFKCDIMSHEKQNTYCSSGEKMSYRELQKLYYEDKDKYASEYEKRFNSSDAIRFSFRVKDQQAFFIQNAETASYVFQILKADKNISLLCTQLPGAALEQYKRRCLIDEIVLTNKIEGVYSTRREIASILSDLKDKVNRKTARKRFWGLVSQYNKLSASEHIAMRTCEDIRKLYNELVLTEVVEENPDNAPDGKLFRKDSTSVYTTTDKEIHRGTYPESAIYKELGEALSFVNDDSIYSLYRIAVFHYLFGYIHPFYDGNGRLGRFIMSAQLSQELNPLLAYRISYTIAESINDYYNAFKTCNDAFNKGDVTPFLLMMLKMIHTSVLQLEKGLSKRQTQLSDYKQIINELPGADKSRTYSAYLLLLQASLFSENGISTRELEHYLENSYTTVKKELDFVDRHHLLIKNRLGKENHYMLDLMRLDHIFQQQ